MDASSLGDFSKLPPEIRNEIYGLLLTAPSTIKVARHHTKGSKSTKCKLAGTLLYAKKGKAKRRVPCVEIMAMSLLRTSKAFNIEASPIAYSSNTFIFTTALAANDFFEQSREMAVHVRDVEIKSISSWKLLEKLRMMSNPRRIVVGTQTHVSASVEAHARAIWSIIKPMVARTGADIVWHRSTKSFRSHMHADFYGHFPRFNYGTDSKEIQLARLQAFEFIVPNFIMFINMGSEARVAIEDGKERSNRFHAMVVKCWRTDFVKRERAAAALRKAARDGTLVVVEDFDRGD